MDIVNLYKDTTIIDLFKEVWATEKIHGTSAHISWKVRPVIPMVPNTMSFVTLPPMHGVQFFEGGVSREDFLALFNEEELFDKFMAEFGDTEVTLYGEAYGGKCQKMGNTYGSKLRFIVFEVKVGECWLAVPAAEAVALKMGFEFVHYRKIPATLEAIETECLLDSVQAVRNGMGPCKMREGVVLHPMIELRKNNGARIIVKHKRAEFRETNKEVSVDPAKREAYASAKAIAEQWVSPMRLTHVLDKLNVKADLVNMREIINGMFDDVKKEGVGFEWSPEVQKFVGAKTADLVKQRVAQDLRERAGHEGA
jgi:hypothetical protein